MSSVLDEPIYHGYTIDGSQHRKSHGPDEYQDDGRPAIIERTGATAESNHIISVWLNDVVGNHEIDRDSNAKNDLDGKASPTLSWALDKYCLIRVQNEGQLAVYAGDCARKCRGYGDVKLYFDVTKAGSVPPRASIVGRPKERVDEVEEII